MTRQGSTLTERLRGVTQLRAGDKVEKQEWGRLRTFPGSIVREDEQGALVTAKN